MAELLIITRNAKTYSYRRLYRAAQDLGHLVDTVLSNNFSGLPARKHYDLVLHRDSGVGFDDIDLTLASYLVDQNLKVVNNPSTSKELRGKDNQYLWLLKNKLPHIPTLFHRGIFKDETPFQEHDEFVLKTTRGNQGLGVMLIKGRESLNSIVEANHARGDEKYILQPKLNFLSEWRVLVLGGSILGALEKGSADDFRANAKRCQVNAVKKENIPQDILELTNNIQELLPEQFLGLDFGITQTGAKVIEINTTPGFETFDELHNIDVAKKFWENYL